MAIFQVCKTRNNEVVFEHEADRYQRDAHRYVFYVGAYSSERRVAEYPIPLFTGVYVRIKPQESSG